MRFTRATQEQIGGKEVIFDKLPIIRDHIGTMHVIGRGLKVVSLTLRHDRIQVAEVLLVQIHPVIGYAVDYSIKVCILLCGVYYRV